MNENVNSSGAAPEQAPVENQPDIELIEAMAAFGQACIRTGIDVNGNFAFNPMQFDVQMRLQHMHFLSLMEECVASGMKAENLRARFLAHIQANTAVLNKPKIAVATLDRPVKGRN